MTEPSPQHESQDVADLRQALAQVARAAEENSDLDEYEVLHDALTTALTRWPEIEEGSWR